jgi:hypothetical protein
MRSSLVENRRPQNSDPFIQLQTKGEAPPMDGAEVVTVGAEVETAWCAWERAIADGDPRPSRAAEVTGG